MSLILKLSRRTGRLRVSLCATALLAALACNEDESAVSALAPAAESEPAAETEATGAVESAEVPAMDASSATAPGIPFGDWHLSVSNFKAPYTGALYALWPSSATSTLNAARSAGMRLVVSMAGARSYYTNSNRTFNMSKWKSRINLYKNVKLATYASSGTVLGHYLVDEPFCKSCWGGKTITGSEIEEMARYSKSIWPSVPTGVRAPPSKLPSQTYRYLDFAWAQWEGPHVPTYKMTPDQFVAKETALAKSKGLGLVFGLNYLDGGDGSSRILGTYSNARAVNRWAMSAAEVRKVGAAFAKASHSCGVLSWKSDATFDRRSGMMDAKRYVASLAKARSRKSCVI